MIKSLIALLITGMLTASAPTTDNVVESKDYDNYGVEVTYGVVTTEDKDGVLLDVGDEEWGEYNYISYKYVEEAEVGDVVKTVFFKDGEDYVERYDQIVNGFVDWDEEWNTIYEITDGNNTVIGTLPLKSFDTYPLYH